MSRIGSNGAKKPQKMGGGIDVASIEQQILASGFIKDYPNYPKSISGKKLLSLLSSQGHAKTKEHAGQIAQYLMDSGVMYSLTHEKKFKDDCHYRFKASESQSKAKVNPRKRQEIEILVDFEELYQKQDLKGFQHLSLVQFPAEDLEIVNEPRLPRTFNGSVPEFPKEQLVDPSVKMCLDLHSKEFTVVKEKSALYRQINLNRPDFNEISKQQYEIDRFVSEDPTESSQERADQISSLLISENEKITAFAIEQMKKDRSNFFNVTPINLMEIDLFEGKPPATPPIEATGYQLYVKWEDIDFGVNMKEPFFGSVTIYDSKKEKRITETIHFNLSDDFGLSLLKTTKEKIHPVLRSKEAVIGLSEKNPNYYMIVTVEKVLQGDIDSVVETYMKYNNMKEKEKSSITEQVRLICTRLGGYRQIFAWGYIELFDDSGDLLLDMEPGYKDTNMVSVKMFAARGDSGPHLSNMFNEKDFKKLKTFPNASCKLLIKPQYLEALPKNAVRVTPSLTFVNPVNPKEIDLSPKSQFSFQREVQEFSSTLEKIYPQLYYCNNLYVYPESVNLSGASGRNILVQISLLPGEDSEPLQAIYGRDSEKLFATAASTSVFYHQKKPTFHDEIKVKIPISLTRSHHIKFTFYHVPVKLKEKKVPEIIGYAFLPIYSGRILEDGVHNLPVASTLSPKYLDPYADLKWMENRKPLFTVRTVIESSVYSQDSKLNTFFKQFESRNLNDGTYDENLLLKSVSAANPRELVRFFPVVIQELIQVISSHNNNSKEVFLAFVDVLRSIQQYEKKSGFFDNSLFQSYASYFHKVVMHEEFVQIWLVVIKTALTIQEYFEKNEKDPQSEKKEKLPDDTWHYSGFFFSLILKSMVMSVDKEDLRTDKNRKNRFSKTYTDNLASLMTTLVEKLQQLASAGKYKEVIALNGTIAEFLRDLFSIMDRGIVFAMVQKYLLEINPLYDSEILQFAKVDFLGVLSTYPHYVPLNLPNQVELDNIPQITLSFSRRHLLVGLVLREISATFGFENQNVREKWISLLQNILCRHDNDERYQDKNKKSHIINMYLPFLVIVIDNLKDIQRMQPQERHKWLLCFVYISSSCSRDILMEWFSKESEKHREGFFKVVSFCLENFEYKGKSWIIEKSMEEKVTNPTGSKILKKERSKFSSKQRKEYIESMYGKKESPNSSKNSSRRSSTSSMKDDVDIRRKYGVKLFPSFGVDEQAAQTQFFCREVSLLVLEILLDLMNNVESDLHEPSSTYMKFFLSTWNLLLRKNQADSVFIILFSQLRLFVEKFSKPLFRFKETASALSNLCYDILKICNFSDVTVRESAAALLFFFIKQNNAISGNFAKMKMNISVNLSKLVGTASNRDDSTDFGNLKKSLEFMSKCAEKEKGSFGEEVAALSKRLFIVLRDSLLISQYRFDPETTTDLFYQISNGYIDSPQLRATWLEHLYAAHLKDQNWEEAAQALLGKVVLITEYIHLLHKEKVTSSFPKKESFQKVSPNIMKEIGVSDEYLSKEDDSVSESFDFTENSVMEMLERIVKLFKSAELFELSLLVYNIMVEYFQEVRDYAKLYQFYQDLSSTCKQLLDMQNSRMFANYYRVAFYGNKFKELNGVHFIYKERKGTLLSQIVARLKKQLMQMFGSGTEVDVLPNTTDEINLSQLDKDKCYFQVISVQPYFNSSELQERITVFQRKFNIDKFIFETPFTKSGSAQTDDISQQYKKKTILTVELAFPYLKKRLKVIDKKEIELSPIENAIELIEKRCQALNTELNCTPPDAKSLQNVLQGSVLAQVNAGPLRICEVFLSKDTKLDLSKEKVEKLREVMNEFVFLCGRAVKLNAELISNAQVEFQLHLEQGYHELRRQLGMKFGGTLRKDDFDPSRRLSSSNSRNLEIRSRMEKRISEKKQITRTESVQLNIPALKLNDKPHYIIAGPPGSGKGAIGEKLTQDFGIVCISTGGLLRDEIEKQTKIGLKVKELVESGNYVPTEKWLPILMKRLQEEDSINSGWMIDGAPREKGQVDVFNEYGITPDKFILLEVPDEVAIERISGRRIDPDTGNVYHMVFSPPEDEDVRKRLIQREDDTEEKIRRRLNIFHDTFQDVDSWYPEEITIRIDASRALNDVYQDVKMALGLENDQQILPRLFPSRKQTQHR